MPLLPSFTSSSCASCLLIHQRPQMEHSVDTGPNNPEQYHLSIDGRQVYCFLSYPLVSSLYTSASSSPVVYSNVVRMEQLVVTWGWLCCSHSDIFKGGRRRHHCCLWSVDDSPACCTSSTLASSWWEGSRACVQGRVQDMPGFDQYRLLKGNTNTRTFGMSLLIINVTFCDVSDYLLRFIAVSTETFLKHHQRIVQNPGEWNESSFFRPDARLHLSSGRKAQHFRLPVN